MHLNIEGFREEVKLLRQLAERYDAIGLALPADDKLGKTLLRAAPSVRRIAHELEMALVARSK